MTRELTAEAREREVDEAILRGRRKDTSVPDAATEGVPLYAMLDVWMALYGTSHPEFDEFYSEYGYAETWARLMAGVRERDAETAAIGRDRLHDAVNTVPNHVWDAMSEIADTGGFTDVLLAALDATLDAATRLEAASNAELVRVAWRDRDAALAAVERVRAVCAEAKAAKARNVATSRRLGYASTSTSENVPGLGEVLAALDGAPEPEWEYQIGAPEERNFEGFGGYASFDDAHADLVAEGESDSWIIHRRRRAGPWLPVEGEAP